MFQDDANYNWLGFGGGNPARQVLAGYGYDPENYIATAQLIPSPYVTQSLIQAKIGGLQKLTEACDDSQPPTGTLNPSEPPNNPAYLTYQSVIQNVVTEINGYVSSIYPIPLAQTGTVAVLQVSSVSTDGLGGVTGLKVLDAGNYCTAPATAQTPVYLRHIDSVCNEQYFGCNWLSWQTGSGLTLTVTYANTNYSDESGQVLTAQTVNGTPTIGTAGTGYNVGDILVLTGGSSFVPAKIREAALILICHSFYQRRLAPDEKNPFATLAKFWREFFVEIGEGEKQLDGTYKRFFSPGTSWNQDSVLFGANSL